MLNPFTWDAPWFVVATGLFVVVMARANGTYWLGRLMAEGTRRTRWRSLLDSPGYHQSQAWLERWGAPVVTLCFLTVGVQTLVNLAAGVGRMPLRRYLPAVTLGCILWAMMYATLGFVGFTSFKALHAWNPTLAWTLLVVAVVALVTLVLVTMRRAHQGRDAIGLG